jgi:hypothetical protein
MVNWEVFLQQDLLQILDGGCWIRTVSKLVYQLTWKIFCWIKVWWERWSWENMRFVRLQKIWVHPCDMWLCVVLIIGESDCAYGHMAQPKEQFECTESCTKHSSSQSVTNNLDTYTLISLSSDWRSSFYDSCEVSAQVRKSNLTVLSEDDNPWAARSGCVIRAIKLVETHV